MSEVKVVWISRHELNEKNREILDKAFGSWELVDWIKETIAIEDIKTLVEKHKDAKFVVVLPPNLLAEFLRFTNEVYRFIVEREVKPDGTAVFTPVGLEKITRIVIETERVV